MVYYLFFFSLDTIDTTSPSLLMVYQLLLFGGGGKGEGKNENPSKCRPCRPQVKKSNISGHFLVEAF